MQTEKIGFIGLGNMGYPMARNLEKAQLPLFVYNRTPEKAAGFLDSPYTTVCSSIQELVANTDIIFTMLTNDKAVKAVYEQIEKETIQDKLFIDLSTISVQTSLDIYEALMQKGGIFMDAPVAGSTGPAADGTLIIMVGGDNKAVNQARPYLEKMGKKVKHLGKNGKGLAAKIALNSYLATLYASLAETMLLADKSGVDRKDILEIINESASGSGATKVKTSMLVDDAYSPAFALDLMVKDIVLAKAAGADYPVANATIDCYLKAQAAGLGQQDVIGIINYLKGL